LKHHINTVVTGLLLLMLLSVMPKTYLHELFADHTDVTACNDSDIQGPCIHNQGDNCQQTDNVVPSSYLFTDLFFSIDRGYEPVSKIVFCSSVLQNSHSAISDRGPPFCV